ACSSSGDDEISEDGAGGSTSSDDTSSGGSGTMEPASGGSTGAGNAAGWQAPTPVPVAEVMAACASACVHFEEECGVPCPEDCGEYIASVHADCTTQIRDMFVCFEGLEEQPAGSPFRCEEDRLDDIPRFSNDCYAETTDTHVCDNFEGQFCRVGTMSETTFCAEAAGAFGPAAYSCVSSVAPAECSRLGSSASTFCCPEDFEFPEERFK